MQTIEKFPDLKLWIMFHDNTSQHSAQWDIAVIFSWIYSTESALGIQY
jgi:hypothetical protein